MTLRPPEGWRTGRITGLSEVAARLGPIVLSHYPQTAYDPAAIEVELRDGAVLTGAPGGRRLKLVGVRNTVELRVRPGENSQLPITVVHDVTETVLPPREGWFTADLRIRSIHEETPCDMASVWRVLGVNGPGARPARVGLPDGRSERLLGRHYGPLQELLNLLRTRAKHEVVTAECTVVRVLPGSGRLEVKITGKAADFDGAPVKAACGNVSWETRVSDVHHRDALIEGPALRPGSVVTLTKSARFDLAQHETALRRLVTGDVTGDWTSLATLMTGGELGRPDGALAPGRFFADEEGFLLHPAQRDAVRGAVSAPHAYFVKGPPGTGKTTVICEIIRQLAARGERVLLVAPSHIAVDEPLQRVGGKPGIRAIRLSHDEQKVHEETRRYLPDRLVALGAVRVRRRETSRAAQWRAEVESIDTEIALRASLGREGERLADLLAASGRAEREAGQLGEQARRMAEGDDPELAEAQARLFEAETALREEEAAQEAAAAQLRLLYATADELRRVVASVISTTDMAVQWERRLSQLRTHLSGRLARMNSHDIQLGRLGYHDLRRDIGQAEATVNVHRARADELQERITELGGGPVAGFFGTPSMEERALREQRDEARRLLKAWNGHLQRLHTQRAQMAYELPYVVGSYERAAADVGETEREIAEAEANLGALHRFWLADVAVLDGSILFWPPDGDASSLHTIRIPAPLEILEVPTLPPFLAFSRVAQVRDSIASHQRRPGTLFGLRSARAERATELSRLMGSAETRKAALRDRLDALARSREQLEQDLQRQRAVMAEAAARVERVPNPAERQAELTARREFLVLAIDLEDRWCELVRDIDDERISEDVQLSYTRSANLVCATTAGIAGRGSEIAGSADFDTMILDEASRVTDTQFLIGAVRARRWVLVGDEHQLPPHVGNEDERFLHALVALDRHDREGSGVREAVEHLAASVESDEEIRKIRVDDVATYATSLRDWEHLYRDGFKEARRRTRETTRKRAGKNVETDVDRAVLLSIRDHFVHSLFERRTGQPALTTALDIQSRMVDPIASLVRDTVYDGAYRTAQTGRVPVPLTTTTFTAPVVFLDTSAHATALQQQVGTGYVNELEATWVVKACQEYERHLRVTDPEGAPVSVSVLAMYKAQADLIWKRLGGPAFPQFRRLAFTRVVPVDRSQGQESDLIMLSFTRARTGARPGFAAWLQDLRRLNVACTRAKRALVLVGHRDTLSRLGPGPAQGFYKNLFEQLDGPDPAFQQIRDLT
ncbi:DEAD/DEAH box helicase [Herbidospora sp. RD11066]